MSSEAHRSELRWMERVMERVRDVASRHRRAYSGGDTVDLVEYGRLYNSIQRIDSILVLLRKQRTDMALAAALDIDATLRELDSEACEDGGQDVRDVDDGTPPAA